MDIFYALAIVALAGFIHSSFQLSVSVLTMIKGHAIGAKRSHGHVLRLGASFIFGTGIMTILLLSLMATVLVDLFNGNTPEILWAIAAGVWCLV